MKRSILIWQAGIPLLNSWAILYINWVSRCLSDPMGCSLNSFFIRLEPNVAYWLLLGFLLPTMIFLGIKGQDPEYGRLWFWIKLGVVPFILSHIWGTWRYMLANARCWKVACSLSEFMLLPLFGAGISFYVSVIWYLICLAVILVFIFRGVELRERGAQLADS